MKRFLPLLPLALAALGGSGFYRIECRDGVHVAVGPAGADRIRGIDHVRYEGVRCEVLGYAPYGRGNAARYASRAQWETNALSRLKAWRFNLLGVGSDWTLRRRGLSHVEVIGAGHSFAWKYGSLAGNERNGGAGFPDVFMSEWPAHCRERARAVCTRSREDKWLFGYYLDNELSWWARRERTSGMFDAAMAKAPEEPAKRAVCELLRKAADNSLDVFNRQWGLSLEDWSALSALRQLSGTSESCEQVKRRFLEMTAERYFSVLTAAIREVDPNHLILGCRFMGTETADDTVWTVAGRHCDVVSVNVYPQVDVTGGRCWADRGRKVDFDRRLDDLHRLAHRPLLISEWSFAGLDTPLRCKVCAAQKFPSQVARAEAATFWMDRLETKPYVVGWEFFMWTDDPVEGYSRTWPEDANFGLVNVEDEPYREMVAAFEGRQSWCPRFSRAGYWEVPGSPRKVTCLNGDWQFSLDGFKTVRTVAVPHCIDEGELPLQASGGVNRRLPSPGELTLVPGRGVWETGQVKVGHDVSHVEADQRDFGLDK